MGKRLDTLLRRGYALIFAFVFIFYIGMAVLAPVLMADGHETAGNSIYRGFRFFCHQYPWRAWFLRGDQPYYPLFPESGLMSFEEASGFSKEDISPRSFYGTPEMGYKMAVCERDMGIYAAMGLFSLLFFFRKNSIPCLDLRIWLVLGVLPMALDGGYQLLSQLLPFIPFRESTPFQRTLTGALFGIFTCWYLLPMLEKSLDEEDAL